MTTFGYGKIVIFQKTRNYVLEIWKLDCGWGVVGISGSVDLFPCMSINPWGAVYIWRTMHIWRAMDERCTVNGIGWLMNSLNNWSVDWGDDWLGMVVNTALMAHSRWNVFDNLRYMIFRSVVVGQWKSTISMDTTWGSSSNGNENRQHQL